VSDQEGVDEPEEDLYQDLVNDTFGPAVRLEQERVSLASLEHLLSPV
jgi:hypothetical protein